MKFLNNLYSILKKESAAEYKCYDILLDANNEIYKAHFPGEPITPGVCVIQIAKELVEDYLDEDILIQSIKNVKFLNVISPENNPQVTYVLEKIIKDSTAKTVKAQILVKSADTQLAKLSFTCKIQ